MIKINNAIIEKASQPVSGQSEKGEWHKVDFVIRFSPRTSSDGKMYYDRLCLTAFNNMGLQQLVLQLAGTDSMVDISINCAVSEYNGRWFNQLRAYTVSSVSVTDVKPKKTASNVGTKQSSHSSSFAHVAANTSCWRSALLKQY